MADKPATRSCLDCPSNLNAAEAAGMLGKSINAPVCARLGVVLGRPGATVKQNTDTMQKRAAACPSYGLPRPHGKPSHVNLQVALPDPDARIELDPLDNKRSLVNTCHQCTNFVPDDKVLDEIGWSAGVCRAKGVLIPANKRADMAKGCEFKQVGPQMASVNLPLLPIFVEATTGVQRDADSIIEPLDWPSDREVTPEDEEHGIQAWREVQDPEGTDNCVYLPIFDPKTFTEEERQLIPQTGDDEHPELFYDHQGVIYQIAALWMELDETPAAWGQPGVGKTEVFRHLAWMMQVPFHRFSIKPTTELYELEGTMLYDPNKGTDFRDGRFTTAWQSKCVIVVDEPNLARTEVWAFLRPCMDNSKQLVIDSDGGRKAIRNDFAFMGLAMNPNWSPLNVGTAPIGAADASRMIHLEFSLPEEQIERQIVTNRIKIDGWEIDKGRLDLVFAVSAKIRELCDMGELSISWGIRENIKAARLLRWFDPIRAYRMAAGDYLEPPQRDSLLDQVRAADPGVRFPKPKPVGS